jgi:hypothetical protein
MEWTGPLLRTDHVKVKVPLTDPKAHWGGVTSALQENGWSAPHPCRFFLGKDPVPIVQEAGWAPGLVCTCAKTSLPPGFDFRTAQPVANRYTDWAIPTPHVKVVKKTLEIKLEGRRRMGRRRMRCLEDPENNPRESKVKRRLKKAADREE